MGRCWTFEKLAPIVLRIEPGLHPKNAFSTCTRSVRDVLHQGLIPNFAGGFNGQLFFFLMANIGTTIAPWMLFFQQSAVVDKGMLEKDIPWGRFDTLLGSIVTVIVAVFIVIVTGTVLPGIDIDSAAQAASELMKTDRYVGTLLAIGLFDATGLLGAICISLSEFLSLPEKSSAGAHSLNTEIRQAPWFYATYFLMLVTSGLVVLIPQAPLVLITLFVQVIAVTLLPAALGVFQSCC